MKIYLVGGAVRDTLLGLTPSDHDYVVVGSTPEEMLAAGFTQVGAHFPVFLHPDTHCEYALARIDHKVGDGHTGFTTTHGPSVTLEEDLSRRDFTINSMAMCGDTLVDPFGGANDLRNKVLRHTSESFVDDPLRVLRGVRFASRLGFTIDPSTREMMLSTAPTMATLHPSRIVNEIIVGVQQAQSPSDYVNLLFDYMTDDDVPPVMRGVFQRPTVLYNSPTPSWVVAQLLSADAVNKLRDKSPYQNMLVQQSKLVQSMRVADVANPVCVAQLIRQMQMHKQADTIFGSEAVLMGKEILGVDLSQHIALYRSVDHCFTQLRGAELLQAQVEAVSRATLVANG